MYLVFPLSSLVDDVFLAHFDLLKQICDSILSESSYCLRVMVVDLPCFSSDIFFVFVQAACRSGVWRDCIALDEFLAC